MGAPIGNEYYKVRLKDGKDKQYETPQKLLDACNEYFQWCIENPLVEEQANVYQGTVRKFTLSKLRAFTVHGLCNFLDISTTTWSNYRNHNGKEYLTVVSRVDQMLYDQKFTGAAANLLNSNIIARDLGLQDKKVIEDKRPKKIQIEIIDRKESTQPVEEQASPLKNIEDVKKE
jgi:hypothetical protein